MSRGERGADESRMSRGGRGADESRMLRGGRGADESRMPRGEGQMRVGCRRESGIVGFRGESGR